MRGVKLSPIQLEAYALTDLAYQANQDHKPNEETAYRDEDIVVEHKCERTKGDDPLWEISLSLRIQPRADANAPFYISLQLSGLVRALPGLKTENLEQLITVNGASLLYGVAREVVRQVTSIGPYAPMLIPSVTFRPESPKSIPAESPPKLGNQPPPQE